MEISLANIEEFYCTFPFSKRASTNSIDYKYFEKTIPKIVATNREYAKFPPALNIFEGLNVGESELRHCSLLSWFLDPSANHCQKELFLKIFLEQYNLSNIENYISGGYFTVSTEDNFSEHERVDITVSSNNFWFVIEAKILANEQEDQIKRYRGILEKKSHLLNIPISRCKLFFLTKDGKEPNSGKADYCISWREIAKVLISFSSSCKNPYVSETARQYANYINTYI